MAGAGVALVLLYFYLVVLLLLLRIHTLLSWLVGVMLVSGRFYHVLLHWVSDKITSCLLLPPSLPPFLPSMPKNNLPGPLNQAHARPAFLSTLTYPYVHVPLR